MGKKQRKFKKKKWIETFFFLPNSPIKQVAYKENRHKYTLKHDSLYKKLTVFHYDFIHTIKISSTFLWDMDMIIRFYK